MKLFAALIASLASASAFAGSGIVVFENDKDGWDAAVTGAVFTLDFDESKLATGGDSFTILPDTYSGFPLSPQFIAVDSPTSSSGESVLEYIPEESGFNPTSGSNVLSTEDSRTRETPQGAILVTFDAPVSAVGAFFLDVDSDIEGTGIEVDGTLYTFSEAPGNATAAFFGIISDVPFTSAVLHLSSEVEDEPDGVVLDDLHYARAFATAYVDKSAPPGGDGTSWETAFTHLQDALLTVESGDIPSEIRVAGGHTYYPDEGGDFFIGDTDASFQIRAGVRVVGGYAGRAAAEPDEYDPGEWPTVLCGDLLGNDMPDDPFSRVDNSRTIVEIGLGAEDDPKRYELRGVTVEHGVQGIRLVGTDRQRAVLIDECVIQKNGYGTVDTISVFEAPPGHALDARGTMLTSVTVQNSRIADNVDQTGAAVWIGTELSDNTLMLVTGCQFVRNSALNDGAAIRAVGPLVITDSTFSHNTSAAAPGVGNGSGAALFVSTSASRDYTVTVDRCVFIENEASGSGGAIFNAEELEVFNSLFVGNTSPGGGAIRSFGGLVVVNSTFTENTIQAIRNLSTTRISNSIFYNNPSPHPGGEIDVNGALDISYSSVNQDLSGTGVIIADPLLSETYGLLPGSPCIDAGSNTEANNAGVTCDLLGNTRFFDDPATVDTGEGAAPITDMGAIEFRDVPAKSCVADLDGDCVVGSQDLASLLAAWGTPSPAANLDGIGLVGAADLAVMLAAWGLCP